MSNIKLIAGHFIKTVWKSKALAPVYTVWLALVLYAVFTGLSLPIPNKIKYEKVTRPGPGKAGKLTPISIRTGWRILGRLLSE